MAKDKKSFVLYSDQRTIIDMLSDEQAGQLLKHIYSYVNDENPELEDLSLKLAFEPIKLQLKRDLKKWDNQREQRSKAGKKSAEKRKRNSTSVNEKERKATVNVNGNVNVTVNDNVNEIAIPTLSDFITYARKHKPKVNQQQVSNKYEAWKVNGWKDGYDKPIKNWKSKLLNSLKFFDDTNEIDYVIDNSPVN